MKIPGFTPYLRLQLKRSGKLLFQVLLVTGLLLCGVGLLAAMILDLDASDAGKQKLNIGIVGDPTDTYLNLGIYAIETLDSSRFSVSFQREDLSEAETQLKAGALHAYLVIPDGFVEAVSRGENKPITYVSTDGALGLGSAIADEVVGSVSDLLLESQNAIFGMQRYGQDLGLDTDLSAAGDQLSGNYMTAILNRESLYDMEIIGVSGNLSMLGYYLCGLSLVFLLLCSWEGTCP
jgi:ABC-type Na+ efflux pump permease subunit